MEYVSASEFEFGSSPLERIGGTVCELKLLDGGKYISASVALVFRMGWQEVTQFQVLVDVSTSFDESRAFASIKEDLLKVAWSRLTGRYGDCGAREEPEMDPSPDQDDRLAPIPERGERGDKTADWMAMSTLSAEDEADLQRELEEIMNSSAF